MTLEELKRQRTLEMAEAQSSSADLGLISDVGRGFDTISSAISGIRPNSSFYDKLLERSDQPVEQLLARRKSDSDVVAEFIKSRAMQNEVRAAEAADKVMNSLYPGQFKEGNIRDLSPKDVSNVFKTQRLREAIKAREGGARPKGGLGGVSSSRGIKSGEQWDPKAVERYQKTLLSHSRDLRNMINGASTIESFTALAKKNPMTAAALPVLLARAIGEKGPLSNFDVQMWGGSKAVIDRLNRAAKMLAQGTLPGQDIEWIKEIGGVLKTAGEQRLGSIEKDITKMYTSNYGGEPDNNAYLITGKRPGMEQPAAPVPKMFYSPSRNETKIVYPDGSEKIVKGMVK